MGAIQKMNRKGEISQPRVNCAGQRVWRWWWWWEDWQSGCQMNLIKQRDFLGEK